MPMPRRSSTYADGGIEARGPSPHKWRGKHRGVLPLSAALADARGRGDNGRMDIVLNGQPRQIAMATSVLQLLQLEGLTERRVAVEVNGEIVPRSRQGERWLTEGDRIEIVHALGGG